MAEKKDVKETTPAEPRLRLEVVVTVKANEQPGVVTGIAYVDIEGEGRRWTYRVNDGWYTQDQLQTD